MWTSIPAELVARKTFHRVTPASDGKLIMMDDDGIIYRVHHGGDGWQFEARDVQFWSIPPELKR